MTDKPGDAHLAPTPTTTPGWAWDRRYSQHPWPIEPDPALVEVAASLAAGSALDLGGGPERNAIWLARNGREVTGVDASAVGLAQADHRAAEADVTIDTIQADLLDYAPPAACFDLVVIANVHLLEPERTRLFAQASAALRVEGHLFVVGHHLDSLGRAGPPDPDRLYTEERLAGAFPTLEMDRLERGVG
ncbi:MAG: class I SAM-dependent methyltransferase, partial [Acidimicrobiales bacterium]